MSWRRRNHENETNYLINGQQQKQNLLKIVVDPHWYWSHHDEEEPTQHDQVCPCFLYASLASHWWYQKHDNLSLQMDHLFELSAQLGKQTFWLKSYCFITCSSVGWPRRSFVVFSFWGFHSLLRLDKSGRLARSWVTFHKYSLDQSPTNITLLILSWSRGVSRKNSFNMLFRLWWRVLKTPLTNEKFYMAYNSVYNYQNTRQSAQLS